MSGTFEMVIAFSFSRGHGAIIFWAEETALL